MTVAPAATVRCLVACGQCGRQYDATGYAARSRFHCSCGTIVEVPRFRANDATVVRCSSCSAPRARNTRSCSHCGADYTLHEQDLQTLCPACMTRVSDRARFCHHCATPIVPQGEVGQKTKHPCAGCGRRHKLTSRSLGPESVTILECSRCAGIWLNNAAFEVLAERARSSSAPETLGTAEQGGSRDDPRGGSGGSMYRRCPECDRFMHRRNFGQGSGVVVDTCKDHGIWFDASELDSILRWIRDGGEARIARKQLDQRRHAERLGRLTLGRDAQTGMLGTADRRSRGSDDGALGEILGALFGL